MSGERLSKGAGLLTVLLLSACARGGHPDPVAAPRCFAAEFGEWAPATRLSPDQQPPQVFELLDETGDRWFERNKRVIRPLIQGYGTPSAFWEVPAQDSLVLTWTNGFEGMHLRLAREGRRWTGTAVPLTDAVVVGRPRPAAPVVVEPVPCLNDLTPGP